MACIIGSARSDENRRYSGGKGGDQRQTAAEDYGGEVSMQPFYIHSKGWIVLRPLNPYVAYDIADKMRTACNNTNIGYSQSDRYSLLDAGVNSPKKVNCDCSTLVRQCVKEAAGKDPGDFYTGNEVEVLRRTGLFAEPVRYTDGMTLYVGDVLVTASKGHTVIVVDGDQRERRSGWFSKDGKWMYIKPSGELAKGWQALFSETGRHWFYFDENGIMLTGWNQIGGKWYYLDTTKDSNEGACWRSDDAGAQGVWTL